jgi:hypothetical protein
LDSVIQGKLDFLQATTDVKNASVQAVGLANGRMGSVKINGTPLTLTAGNSNDDFLVGITNDFRVNEI